MRKFKACSKCGSKELCGWMEKNDWLCDKCMKKWDEFIHEEPRNSDREWNTAFDATWRKYWNEFTPKEKVVFT